MDNRIMYGNPNQPGGYYQNYYQPVANALLRPDQISYGAPPLQPSVGIKGRPVSSFEEARVAQIDLDGSVSFFPDLGNKKIYTKRINPDGTATISVFTLDEKIPETPPAPEYVTKDEFSELKQTLDAIVEKLKVATTQNQSKINF